MLSLSRIDSADPRLARLLQLYLHEWSALLPVPIGDDALYVYKDLPLYAVDDRRAAFLFLDGAGRQPIGFAMTLRDDRDVTHVEEFFILAGQRRRGAGREAALLLLETQPGGWTLTVRPENPAALRFWRSVFPGAAVAEEPGTDGVVRTRLTFEAR